MAKLGALAVVKAHPLVFSAVLAISIGIVVYQIVQSRKQKKMKHKLSRSNGGGGDDSSGSCNDFYFYDPSTKSISNSAAPVRSDESENNLRKRSSVKNPAVSKEVQTDSIDMNQNDINKTLPDKNLNTVMSVDEKINDYLRNIRVPESADDNGESNSENSIIKPIKNCCCDCESHSADDSSSSSSASDSSSWSDLSDASVKKRKKRAASTAPSVISIESETSVGTILSGNSTICRGCEEKPVNTHTQPCNHRYLCSDCAMRVFRLFKRCKVCRARIESIVVED